MKRIFLFFLFPILLPACTVKLDLESDILEGEGTAVSWMERLPDNTPLTALYIPGAHDAASSSITSWTLWTRTQEKNIAELWNCGVRAFDLRSALVDGELGIYHDKYSAHVTFPQVMEALILALRKHPGECAIVIIRHEEEADGNAPGWKDAMDAYLNSISSSLFDHYNPSITLGELRGRILVLGRGEYMNWPLLGGSIQDWSHSEHLSSQQGAFIAERNGNAYPIWVQDYYHPGGADDKWAAVKGLLDATASAGDSRPLVINHASGYLGGLPDYRTNARDINIRAADYISTKKAPAGIVIMDFAGTDRSNGVSVGGDRLVRALIENN